MADALCVIPASVLRNLSEKLYEKRKNAALELEGIVKQLAAAGDHDKITAVINLLTNEFTYSPQANHRKGGLIGLAAATVGLSLEATQHLEQIVPPVLNSFSIQDSRVRYYACEALYNIAKVVRGDFIVFFNQIFDALCKLSADSDPNVQSAAHLLDRLVKDIVTESDQFSIEEFIPLLRERMNVLNPYVRQFLVGWITVLDSVPDIDMLGFLPDFLDGLFNMLSDSSHEIRQQADSALSEFLQEIKNSPVLSFLNDIFDTLLKALSDPSDEVVFLVLEVHACIAEDPQHFRQLVVFLVHNFRIDNSLLEKRGALIIRRLCVLLDAERVYCELSTILEGESDLDFASIMVQALNLILLTSSELAELRDLLKQSMVNPSGKDLFLSLYSSWRHSPTAIISLCLLAQAYQHTSSIIQSLVEEDINVKFLVQLDKLINLLETPIFAYLRLQLLEPGRYIWLLKALYGLLMLLPQQSMAFKILRTRLKTVPSYSFTGDQFKWLSGSPYSQIEVGDMDEDLLNAHNGINFASRLQQFEQMQQQHRMNSKSQSQSRYSSNSSMKEVKRPEESRLPLSVPDMSRPPSRSSRRGC
ncbi:protein VAC14 homolog isoform X2 [Actinidia eriantha]|uniref:protein VAC14 homolog isoform X2 n=1 Tax=Actinidia eriantha TaxID=165200 RepID=UPI002589EBAD|nr:protein VAC14 homolog isoform X2 [Actinidia eriantha]